eukprot:Phypoly_transcript_28045.p1 GENE.Phypoly_transcript_28045~~Phypoly_transcript_28045.p1  ORF type:complete len:137 (+),score=22.63 Phypoly_transcript_28045:60-413(+)
MTIHNRHTIELQGGLYVRPSIIPSTAFDPEYICVTAKNIDRRTTVSEINGFIHETLHAAELERRSVSQWVYTKDQKGGVIPTKIVMAAKNKYVITKLTEKNWKPYGRQVFWKIEDHE